MKKILVTGAGGLVGHAAAEYLIKKQEYEVFPAFHSQILNNDWKNILQIDLENTTIENLNINFDCIVHCAARIPNSVYSDEETAYINRYIDNNIIQYCSSHKCRLVYISSIAIYENNGEQLTEQSKINIDSKYAQEKRNSEIKIESECCSYCILRVPSPFGAMQKNRNVLKIWIEAVLAGKDICYFGTGERTQDFIDARDIAKAVWHCLEQEVNGIFNIASGSPVSMKHLAELIVKTAKNEIGSTSKIYAGNPIDTQENIRTNIDISLAGSALGWQPQIRLEDGIQDWMRCKRENG